MINPTISVILPVYNGANFLRDAIQSILTQSFYHFELIVINDGSKDHSESIIQDFLHLDHRVIYIRNEKNLGLIATLNKGISLARGEYIARMDQDDIALPKRLELQINFLSKIGRPALLGGNIVTIDKDNHIIRVPRPMHTEDYQNEWVKFRKCPMHHPTVMFSKSITQVFNPIYDPENVHAEDYSAWLKINEQFPIYNLDDVLLYYRIHDHNISKVYSFPQNQKMLSNLQELYFKKFQHRVSTDTIDALMHLRLTQNHWGLRKFQSIIKDIVECGVSFLKHRASTNEDLIHFTSKDIAYSSLNISLRKSPVYFLFAFFKLSSGTPGLSKTLSGLFQASLEVVRSLSLKSVYIFKIKRLLKKLDREIPFHPNKVEI